MTKGANDGSCGFKIWKNKKDRVVFDTAKDRRETIICYLKDAREKKE